MKLRHNPDIHFAALGIDAAVIAGPENVRYLTGYTGSNGLLVLFAGRDPVFFTDPRYTIQSATEVSCRTKIVKKGGLLLAASNEIRRAKARSVGFESEHMSYEQYQKLAESLDRSGTLTPMEDHVANRRMIKDDAEIATVRESVQINSKAFDRALKKIRPGMTESELAAEIDYQMRRLGAEKPSFETIVAAGDRTALPHARPGDRRLGGNELVLIDMGAFRRGYASDMTRTLHLGRPPAKTRRMYDAVLEAQLAGIDAVRPGISAEQVDRACRKVLKRHGLDRAFTHSTGHGLGLEIHEAPRLGKGDATPLLPGMTVTIEPGVYVEGFGGIRIEDTVLVTEKGCEPLTPTTKDFITL
jgi:Xaa-Pro aminopeptidase